MNTKLPGRTPNQLKLSACITEHRTEKSKIKHKFSFCVFLENKYATKYPQLTSLFHPKTLNFS